MATVSAIKVADNDLAPGEETTVDVVFTLNPGSPGRIAHIQVTFDDGTRGSADMTLAIPAEVAPAVAVGAGSSGWRISCDGGTLRRDAADPPNRFRLRNG